MGRKYKSGAVEEFPCCFEGPVSPDSPGNRMSLFVCLVYHRNGKMNPSLFTDACILRAEFQMTTPQPWTIAAFEKFTGVAVNIVDQATTKLKHVGTAQGSKNVMNVVQKTKTGKFAYIKNMEMFNAGPFPCPRCRRPYSTHRLLAQHKRQNKNCQETQQPTVSYPSGGFIYDAATWLWFQLAALNISTNATQRFAPFFVFFDLETKFEPMGSGGEDVGCSTHYQSNMIPASYSLAGNLPSFAKRTVFFAHDDPNVLGEQLWADLEKASLEARKLLKPRYRHIFVQLREKIRHCKEEQQLAAGTTRFVALHKRCIHIEKIYKKLQLFIGRLAVLSYNFSKFDGYLLLPRIAKFLQKDKDLGLITKNMTILTLFSRNLVFTDFYSFFPGQSLESLIKMVQGGDKSSGGGKLAFPYQLFTSVEALKNTTQFPAYEAFFSTLKGRNISPALYETTRQHWESLPVNERNLLGLLRIYNNADVSAPVLEACHQMQKWWSNNSYDLSPMRSVFTLSQLAVRFGKCVVCESVMYTLCMCLFSAWEIQDPCLSLRLFGEHLKEAENVVNAAVVGGLSAVFTRRAVVGETHI